VDDAPENVNMTVPHHRISLVQFFADLIQRNHGTFNNILDLGCGELQHIWHQRWGNRYEGLDNRTTIGADYIGDACDLSRFESNSRDVVCAWSTLEHVTCPYVMLEEMKRVSRGTCVLTTDYTEHDKNGDPTHLYMWNEKVLGQLVKSVHMESKVYVERGILIAVMYRCQDD